MEGIYWLITKQVYIKYSKKQQNWIVHEEKNWMIYNYSIARIRCLKARDRSVICNKSNIVMLLLVACPKLEKSPVETGFNTWMYIDLLAEHDRCLPDHQHPGC